MRIVLLPSAYAPAVGGVEVLTTRLAHHLVLRGHDVEVWTGRSEDDSLPVEETIKGMRVRRFVFTMPRVDLRSTAAFPVAAVTTLNRLRSAAREFRPDVLHVQCFSGNGAYATALSRLTGTPLVVTLQGETVMDDHDIYDRSAALRLSLRLGLRRAAAVTGCSAFTLRDAEARFGLDMSKTRVIFNGVDVDETPPIPVALPFERYVLGLGRVVHKKGFDLLLEAFAGISALHPDVGLVIAGEGAEREPLRQRALALGLAEKVHLPGRLGRGQVAAVMDGAEVFVMPSRVEPFGIVVLEAWRAGVPVVVTPHGGASEFVTHKVSGLVADPFKSDAMASAIDALLNSRALRVRLADAGASEVPSFGWSRLAESYGKVYRASIVL